MLNHRFLYRTIEIIFLTNTLVVESRPVYSIPFIDLESLKSRKQLSKEFDLISQLLRFKTNTTQTIESTVGSDNLLEEKSENKIIEKGSDYISINDSSETKLENFGSETI